jgi:hypothetical protein
LEDDENSNIKTYTKVYLYANTILKNEIADMAYKNSYRIVFIHNCTSGNANDNNRYDGFGLAAYHSYIGQVRIFLISYSTNTTQLLIF